MNERIRELIKQATHVEEPDGLFSREVFDEEKFAELIVQECAQRCEDIAIKHQVEETTYAAGKKAGAFECAEDLLKHFGVEQ